MTCLVYATVQVYTGQVIFPKVPAKTRSCLTGHPVFSYCMKIKNTILVNCINIFLLYLPYKLGHDMSE